MGRLRYRYALLISLIFVLLVSLSKGSLSAQSKREFLKSKTTPVVCIDPGHPSETSSGKVIVNDTTELKVCWEVALKLGTLLRKNGINTVMTKSYMNECVTNRERTEIANGYKANLLFRIHTDYGNGRGITTYYPSAQGRKEEFVGPDRSVIEVSKIAAFAIHPVMAESLSGYLKDNGVKTDSRTEIGKRQGALTGSIYSKVPVVLVEMCYLNNKGDASFIKSEEGQWRMAQGMAKGITLFLEQIQVTSSSAISPRRKQ